MHWSGQLVVLRVLRAELFYLLLYHHSGEIWTSNETYATEGVSYSVQSACIIRRQVDETELQYTTKAMLIYRGELKSLYVLLSRTQAGPGIAVKQGQEENSLNHVQAFK